MAASASAMLAAISDRVAARLARRSVTVATALETMPASPTSDRPKVKNAAAVSTAAPATTSSTTWSYRFWALQIAKEATCRVPDSAWICPWRGARPAA